MRNVRHSNAVASKLCARFKNRFSALAHWALGFLGRSRAERTITPGQLSAEERQTRAPLTDGYLDGPGTKTTSQPEASFSDTALIPPCSASVMPTETQDCWVGQFTSPKGSPVSRTPHWPSCQR